MSKRALNSFVSKLGKAQAAKRFGVSASTVARWQKQGVSKKYAAYVKDDISEFKALQAVTKLAGPTVTAKRLGVTTATLARWQRQGAPAKNFDKILQVAAKAKRTARPAKKLDQLVKTTSAKATAKRFGVTEKTVKRWQRQGVPKTRKAEFERAIKRRKRSLKAAETRRDKFRASVGRPEDSELSTKRVVPGAPPKSPFKEYERIESEYFTTRYKVQDVWIPIKKGFHAITSDQIASLAQTVFENTSNEYARVIFLAYRFIPFNPAYRGAMAKKQGQWVSAFVSTSVQRTMTSLAGDIDKVFWGGTRTPGMMNSLKGASKRVIWLEAINVQTMDLNE